MFAILWDERRFPFQISLSVVHRFYPLPSSNEVCVCVCVCVCGGGGGVKKFKKFYIGGLKKFFWKEDLMGKEGSIFQGGFRVVKDSNYKFYITTLI